MVIAENIKEHLAAAMSTRGADDRECDIHHNVARIIPRDIDAENLILAYKIIIDEHEKNGGNVLEYVSQIPSYVKKGTSKEFFHEFRRGFTSELMGITLPEYGEENYGCVEVNPDVIDISNKNKYKVFAELYNAIAPIGMGFAQYNPLPLDENFGKQVFEKAGRVLSDGSVNFRYVMGRLMNCTFKDNLLFVKGYNYEHEEGLAQVVVSSCPNVKQKEKAPQKVKKD